MLSIGKLGHGQADYYLQAVGQGIEDYYTGQGEAPGRWLGSAATELELDGQVDPDALRAVLNGSRPDGSGPLTRSGQGASRVPGFDLTFSAPKSVSLLFALGDPEVSRAVRDAHEAAVEAGLDYMERHAAMGRRGQGGAICVLGNGFIAAGFRHRTSRAGDPQLHTHVLVANLTKGPDQRWTALDARRLYAHARTGGFIYQAKLRLELTRGLGIEWTPIRHGVAEVDGIPIAVRRAFSRRRAEIETELTQRGETSAGAAQVAALHTRREKDYAVPAATLTEQWRERARQLDFEPETIDQLLGQTEIEPLPLAAVEEGQASLASPSGLTERRASFTRRDVVQAWCERLAHGGEVAEIERLADDLVSGDGVIALVSDASSLTTGDVVRRADGRLVAATSEERRYSTPELLAFERDIIDVYRRGRDSGRGQVPADAIEETLAGRPELADEQRELVRRLLGDGDQVAVVVGKAGTGKTYALDAARATWQAGGHRVIGAALARRAALELRDGAGIESTSIHALLADLRERPGELLGPRTVLVIDEAGMVGTRQLAEIVAHVERADAKLVLVGDPRQLPEIDAGGSFRALAIRGNPIRLSENRRQQSDWERDALELLRRGLAEQALAAYREHGRLILADSAPEQRERMVEDWWQARQAGHDAIMVALRRTDVGELNDRARARMAAHGRLGPDSLTVHGLPVAVGDEIVCLRNHTGLGVVNGTQGTVTAVDHDNRSLTFSDRDGHSIMLPATYLDTTTERGGPTLGYGYALTGHKAQGVTVDEVFVLGSDALYREWGYVAMSRGRHANRLYLVSGEPELDNPLRRSDQRDPVARMTQALARSAAQLRASDAATHHNIANMSLSQLRDRLNKLDSEAQAEQRGTRRQRALEERAIRLGKQAPPPPAADDRSDTHQSERATVIAEIAHRVRSRSLALALDPPPYLTNELGPVPDELAARRRWRAAAEQIEELRERAGFTDPDRALPDQVQDQDARARLQALRRQLAREESLDAPGRERGIGR